jgi:hypothetical protein
VGGIKLGHGAILARILVPVSIAFCGAAEGWESAGFGVLRYRGKSGFSEKQVFCMAADQVDRVRQVGRRRVKILLFNKPCVYLSN